MTRPVSYSPRGKVAPAGRLVDGEKDLSSRSSGGSFRFKGLLDNKTRGTSVSGLQEARSFTSATYEVEAVAGRGELLSLDSPLDFADKSV